MNTYYKHTTPHITAVSNHNVYSITHTHTCAYMHTHSTVLHMQTHHQLRNGHNGGVVYPQSGIVDSSAVPQSNERGNEEIKGMAV